VLAFLNKYSPSAAVRNSPSRALYINLSLFITLLKIQIKLINFTASKLQILVRASVNTYHLAKLNT